MLFRSARHKEYYRNNKAKVIERGRKNRALRRAIDPDYVLKHRIRSQIRDHLKRNLLTKNFHTFELLGYTADDLRQHLESQFETNSKPDKEKMSRSVKTAISVRAVSCPEAG